MVDCGNPVRLDAYHDGELSPAERADVEAHVRDCPPCAAELAAIRRLSAAFAEAPPREPSDAQLMRLARGVRAERYGAEPSDERMLLRLFRATAVAAAVLLACTLAGAAYLSQRTRAAAHEAMILDHVAMGSRSAALAGGPGGEGRQSEEQVLLAQWIAEDLTGRQEER